MKILPPFLLLTLAVLTAKGQESAPNIVFLLVDDLGYADFGCYGATFNETPNIDTLASEGMLFSDAYAACTVCSPSRAAILTGCYPARIHLTDWITGRNYPYTKLTVPDWKTKIDHERTLMPEALRESGYSTAFFGKWHLMPIRQPDFKEHYPTNHGFDINIGGREWGRPKGRGKYFSPFDVPNLEERNPGSYLTDALTDAANAYLREVDKSKPFFLYLSYYTLHGPLMAPPERVAKYKAKALDFKNHKNEYINPKRSAMVESLDISVGRIMDTLESLGLSEDTVIILTGDNGGDADATDINLKGFKGYSHEGGVRQPLIVKWPTKVPAGSRSNAVVTGTDFYPTVLEMAGLPLRPDSHEDGISILPILTGERLATGRDAIYWHYPHYHRTDPYGAVRDGDWKLIEFFENGRLELYNLKTDPTESRNLAEDLPEKANDLLKQLKQWRHSIGAQEMNTNPNYDPNRERQRD